MNEWLLEDLINQSDVVYHLAAAVGVKLIINKPVETIETNIRGTENVLKFANKARTKVLIASTSEVYGKIPHEILVKVMTGNMVQRLLTAGVMPLQKQLMNFLPLLIIKNIIYP